MDVSESVSRWVRRIASESEERGSLGKTMSGTNERGKLKNDMELDIYGTYWENQEETQPRTTWDEILIVQQVVKAKRGIEVMRKQVKDRGE